MKLKGMDRINRGLKVTAGLVFVLSVVLAAYIMVNHMGLADGLDFGAGAYYYADIPEFDRFVSACAYETRIPSWVIFGIFLLWGAAMYRLWVWIDGKDK